jgi:hypothetical protein
VRILATASDSGRAFDLRCEIREKLLLFLRQEYPQALPRFRAELVPRGSLRRMPQSESAA